MDSLGNPEDIQTSLKRSTRTIGSSFKRHVSYLSNLLASHAIRLHKDIRTTLPQPIPAERFASSVKLFHVIGQFLFYHNNHRRIRNKKVSSKNRTITDLFATPLYFAFP